MERELCKVIKKQYLIKILMKSNRLCRMRKISKSIKITILIIINKLNKISKLKNKISKLKNKINKLKNKNRLMNKSRMK